MSVKRFKGELKTFGCVILAYSRLRCGMSTSMHLKREQLRGAVCSNVNSQVNGPLQCERFRRAADVFVPKLNGTTARPAGGRAAGRNNRHLGAALWREVRSSCKRCPTNTGSWPENREDNIRTAKTNSVDNQSVTKIFNRRLSLPSSSGLSVWFSVLSFR